MITYNAKQTTASKQFELASRPDGIPTEDKFLLNTVELSPIATDSIKVEDLVSDFS